MYHCQIGMARLVMTAVIYATVIITTIAAFAIMTIAKNVHRIALNVTRLFAWAVVVNARNVRNSPVRIV